MARKTLWAAAIFFALLAPGRAMAQTLTTVTGTIVGSDGVPWAGARVAISLNVTGTPSYTPCNNPNAGCQIQNPGSVNANGSGSFTVNVWASGSIACVPACASPTYTFNASSNGAPPPLGTGPQVCTLANQTIAGASQALAFAGCPALSSSPGSATAAALAGNQNAIYLSPACPNPYSGSGNCYPAYANGQQVLDATFTASSATITTSGSDPPFACPGSVYPCSASGTGSDVGKAEFGVYNVGDVGGLGPCCGTYNCPQGTISTVNSAHSVTVSVACTNNSSVIAGTYNVFLWGTDDASNISAAYTAIQSSTGNQGQALFLPCGMMFMGSQALVSPTSSSSRTYAIGVNGCPGNATTIVPLPRLNCEGASNGGTMGCLLSDGYQALENQTQIADEYSNIFFWGGGISDKDPSATYTATAGVWAPFIANVSNVWVEGWDWDHAYANTLYGIECQGCTMVQSGTYGGGGEGCYIVGYGEVPGSMTGGSCGASQNTSIVIGCNSAGQIGKTLGVYANASNGGTSVVTSPSVYSFYVQTGCVWTDSGSNAHGGITTSTSAVLNLAGTRTDSASGYSLYANGGNIHLSSVFFGSGSNALMAAGQITDQGGNNFSNLSGGMSFTGGEFDPFKSVAGACTGTATSSSTLGLYGTGPNETTTTCTSTTIGSGIQMDRTGNLFYLQVSATHAGVSASSGVVTVFKNGSATTVTCTIGTGTSCNDTSHIVAFAIGDLVTIEFTTQASEVLAGVKATLAAE
jgi:hypothetical protein